MASPPRVPSLDFPPHWDFSKELRQANLNPSTKQKILYRLAILLHYRPVVILLRVFCVTGFGCSDLKDVWERSSKDEWLKVTQDIRKKLEQLNIVVRLL